MASSAAAATLSEAGRHAGTLDLTGTGPGPGDGDVEHIEIPEITGEHPDNSRRFGGPMGVQQYKFSITLMLVSLMLLVVALFISTKSLQQSNKALSLATSLEDQMLMLTVLDGYTIPDDADSAAVEAGGKETATSAPTVGITPNPTQTTPNPTTSPSFQPTARPTSAAPTVPHPFDPKWYQTTHADYQFFSDTSMHAWTTSNALCSKQSRVLCDYETYCPNGQGGKPYGGGPPKIHNWDSLKEIQWAPYKRDPDSIGDPNRSQWAQIGVMSAELGGSDDNGYVQCWKYDDWYGGEGLDIVEKWEDEHRMWTLCCETAPEE